MPVCVPVKRWPCTVEPLGMIHGLSPTLLTVQSAVNVKSPSSVRVRSVLLAVRSALSGYVAVAPPGNFTGPFCVT